MRTALEAARPFVPTNAPRLLHGDFWPGNVLWDGDRLRAVLDWEEAALGDPLCDLAQCRVELAWKYGPETTELFTAEYLARSSVDTHALPHWDLFVASAGLAHLGGWGLDAEREATMRAVGAAFLERAAHALLATA